jgi:hypothetical protein
MITPNKYMNLELSVINTGGIILKSLSHCPIQKFDELENTVISVLGNSAKRIFVNALCFLYLLGKISYQSGTDSIKLIES